MNEVKARTCVKNLSNRVKLLAAGTELDFMTKMRNFMISEVEHVIKEAEFLLEELNK